MKILSYILFVLALFPAQRLSAQPSAEKIRLHVGEQKTIHESRVARISVDRRGIVHIVQKLPGVWQITAIRSGVAVVNLYSKSNAPKVLYIDVLPREPFRVKPPPQSEINVNNLEPLKPKFIYEVKVKLELIESQSIEARGKMAKNGLDLDLKKGTIDYVLAGSLQGQNDLNSRNILGSPTYLALDGEEATIKSGGELKFERNTDSGQTISDWHEFGMSLTTKIDQMESGTLLTKVLFVLKNPSANSGKFSLNHIETNTLLTVGSTKLIGTVDLATDDQNHSEDMLAAKIPIIGPLFHQSSTSISKASLRLWMQIDKHE